MLVIISTLQLPGDVWEKYYDGGRRHVFRITSHLYQWIPPQMASNEVSDVLLFFAWANFWIDSRVSGDLRGHDAHITSLWYQEFFINKHEWFCDYP